MSLSQARRPSYSSHFKKVKQELENQVGVLELRTQALLGWSGMLAGRGRPLSLRTTSWAMRGLSSVL